MGDIAVRAGAVGYSELTGRTAPDVPALSMLAQAHANGQALRGDTFTLQGGKEVLQVGLTQGLMANPLVGAGVSGFNLGTAMQAGNVEGMTVSVVGAGMYFGGARALGWNKTNIVIESNGLTPTMAANRQTGAVADFSVRLETVEGATNPKTTEPVFRLEVGKYGDTASRSVGDGLSPDHIPSFAAVKASVEQKIGRDLTPSEARDLRNNTNTLVIETELHQQVSRTYGGRNTQDQIQSDATNLGAAARADETAYRLKLYDHGYTKHELDAAFQRLHDANKKTGIYK